MDGGGSEAEEAADLPLPPPRPPAPPELIVVDVDDADEEATADDVMVDGGDGCQQPRADLAGSASAAAPAEAGFDALATVPASMQASQETEAEATLPPPSSGRSALATVSAPHSEAPEMADLATVPATPGETWAPPRSRAPSSPSHAATGGWSEALGRASGQAFSGFDPLAELARLPAESMGGGGSAMASVAREPPAPAADEDRPHNAVAMSLLEESEGSSSGSEGHGGVAVAAALSRPAPAAVALQPSASRSLRSHPPPSPSATIVLWSQRSDEAAADGDTGSLPPPAPGASLADEAAMSGVWLERRFHDVAGASQLPSLIDVVESRSPSRASGASTPVMAHPLALATLSPVAGMKRGRSPDAAPRTGAVGERGVDGEESRGSDAKRPRWDVAGPTAAMTASAPASSSRSSGEGRLCPPLPPAPSSSPPSPNRSQQRRSRRHHDMSAALAAAARSKPLLVASDSFDGEESLEAHDSSGGGGSGAGRVLLRAVVEPLGASGVAATSPAQPLPFHPRTAAVDESEWELPHRYARRIRDSGKATVPVHADQVDPAAPPSPLAAGGVSISTLVGDGDDSGDDGDDGDDGGDGGSAPDVADAASLADTVVPHDMDGDTLGTMHVAAASCDMCGRAAPHTDVTAIKWCIASEVLQALQGYRGVRVIRKARRTAAAEAAASGSAAHPAASASAPLVDEWIIDGVDFAALFDAIIAGHATAEHLRPWRSHAGNAKPTDAEVANFVAYFDKQRPDILAAGAPVPVIPHGADYGAPPSAAAAAATSAASSMSRLESQPLDDDGTFDGDVLVNSTHTGSLEVTAIAAAALMRPEVAAAYRRHRWGDIPSPANTSAVAALTGHRGAGHRSAPAGDGRHAALGGESVSGHSLVPRGATSASPCVGSPGALGSGEAAAYAGDIEQAESVDVNGAFFVVNSECEASPRPPGPAGIAWDARKQREAQFAAANWRSRPAMAGYGDAADAGPRRTTAEQWLDDDGLGAIEAAASSAGVPVVRQATAAEATAVAAFEKGSKPAATAASTTAAAAAAAVDARAIGARLLAPVPAAAPAAVAAPPAALHRAGEGEGGGDIDDVSSCDTNSEASPTAAAGPAAAAIASLYSTQPGSPRYQFDRAWGGEPSQHASQPSPHPSPHRPLPRPLAPALHVPVAPPAAAAPPPIPARHRDVLAPRSAAAAAVAAAAAAAAAAAPAGRAGAAASAAAVATRRWVDTRSTPAPIVAAFGGGGALPRAHRPAVAAATAASTVVADNSRQLQQRLHYRVAGHGEGGGSAAAGSKGQTRR